ncbi:hypothetical protein Tco_1110870 [Tanacetum coccineum]|uniref:MICOS complex subunit MIC60 n=1 Tax=Tanacetum coccineum TaxID=301880 RepID=A0ABQ5IK05_9ASTR
MLWVPRRQIVWGLGSMVLVLYGPSSMGSREENFVSSHSEYNFHRTAPGSAGCGCEYSGFPRGEGGGEDVGEGACPSFSSFSRVSTLPYYDGERPLLESTAGRTMELVWSNRELRVLCVSAHSLRSVPCISVSPMPGQQALAFRRWMVAEVVSEVEYIGLRGILGWVPTLAAKEETETPPLNVEATSDSSAPVTHAAQSPPQTGPKAFDGMPVNQLVEEFDTVTAQQAALVAQLRARFANERSQSIQKDEEILLLKAQLVDAQAEAESSRSYAQHLAEEKMALLVKVEQERADAAEYKASCHWAVKYLEGGKNNHFAGLDDFRHKVEGLLEKQEDKLRKLSIEYDEELYPHMLSTIAERRQSFGDVVKCALARGKAEAVEELHERRLLTVPAAQLERDPDYPIGVIMTGLTLASIPRGR